MVSRVFLNNMTIEGGHSGACVAPAWLPGWCRSLYGVPRRVECVGGVATRLQQRGCRQVAIGTPRQEVGRNQAAAAGLQASCDLGVAKAGLVVLGRLIRPSEYRLRRPAISEEGFTFLVEVPGGPAGGATRLSPVLVDFERRDLVVEKIAPQGTQLIDPVGDIPISLGAAEVFVEFELGDPALSVVVRVNLVVVTVVDDVKVLPHLALCIFFVVACRDVC